jgi:hypothetical protein
MGGPEKLTVDYTKRRNAACRRVKAGKEGRKGKTMDAME